MNKDKAINILQDLNILYDISYINAQYEIQKNLILSQYPEPGTYISTGEKIILFIGK
jgi:beta-lactam-binding protein with PASTA domain